MPAPDAATSFVTAARAAFSALCAAHLTPEQRRAANAAIRGGASPRIMVDTGTGVVRAYLVLAETPRPIELLALAAGTPRETP